MIRLDRDTVTVPGDWAKRVADKLPDAAAYAKEAADFEKLPVDSATRKKGFKKYAPSVLPKGKRGQVDFPQLWGVAKNELGKMSRNKCSYCESAIARRGHGQVEHFKPKALFPSLAYEWNNYFLSCGGCNRSKSSKWPADGSYVRPDEGDPSKEFCFDEKGKMAAVNDAGDAGRTMRDFRLNEAWLVNCRKVNIKDALDELGDIIRVEYPANSESARDRARKVVERRSKPELPFSAAINQCMRRAWNAACPDVPL